MKRAQGHSCNSQWRQYTKGFVENIKIKWEKQEKIRFGET